jgi:polyisoprenoid-binding protein YceI
LEGLLLLDKSADEIRHLEITIEMEGVKAMDQSLTEKLKKKGFFQIDQFPESKFIATEIRRESREGDPEGTTHVIVGNFQLRDVTRSISFPANIAVEESKLRLTSEFKINRKDYGVVYSDATGDALIRDNVLINIDIETTVN